MPYFETANYIIIKSKSFEGKTKNPGHCNLSVILTTFLCGGEKKHSLMGNLSLQNSGTICPLIHDIQTRHLYCMFSTSKIVFHIVFWTVEGYAEI